MPAKPYQILESPPMSVAEPVAAYQTATAEMSFSSSWNPNVPFHGTADEWWEHFHRIEEGPFYHVSEAHQRISQWLDRQKP